jgi:hypothetical protein
MSGMDRFVETRHREEAEVERRYRREASKGVLYMCVYGNEEKERR